MKDATTQQLVEEIKKRTEGLMFQSEADFPIHVHCCEPEEPLKDYLLRIAGRNPYEKVEEFPLAYLYKNMNSLEENDENLDSNSMKYKELINFLTGHLQDVKVNKIGEGVTDIVITGASESGKYILVTTKTLESI